MKIELITNVSHDLKTPLTSIINYVDLLSKQPLTPDFANDYVNILKKKSQNLKDLVQDLFEVSKANSGNIELEMEQLDIAELMDQTLAELEEKLTGAGLACRVRRPSYKIFVLADGKKLYRVFENLLVNVSKYALAGTRVYIDIAREGSQVQVSIKNIANYEMDFTGGEVMERFVRGDKSRTTEGYGLGLSIAQSFVAAMSGTIETLVDGDLFKVTVTLPVAAIAPYEKDLSKEPGQEPTMPSQAVYPDGVAGLPAPSLDSEPAMNDPLSPEGAVAPAVPDDEATQAVPGAQPSWGAPTPSGENGPQPPASAPMIG